MRPRERRESGEQDLFRSRLDQIIDMNHPLAKLARTVDWRFLEGRFGEVYTDDPGHPPLPTRLMAGLAILKHTYDLSDEVLCERWVENPYFIVLFLSVGLCDASAQSGHLGTAQEQTACSHDASRFCGKQLSDNSAVQQCLQQNRAKLSASCKRVQARPVPCRCPARPGAFGQG